MLLVLLFNLLAIFFVLFFFGKFFGKKGSISLACFNMVLCFLTIFYIFSQRLFLGANLIEFIQLGTWFTIFQTTISWYFLVDNLSITMLLVVITISSCVHFYSYYYMESDVNIIKFFSYITLFTFFMCILVMSSNFLILFLGWEGVGICSFLLISFWNSRVQANKAALKAMLINRVGDFFLLIAIVLIFLNFRSLDFFIVFSQVPIYALKKFVIWNYSFSIIDFISIFLLLGGITKSAQIGFHGWLPDAMEGPTPVSALIHAATMVTAGVFLFVRSSFIFEFSELSLNLLLYIGSLTALIFGIIGFFQFDIKKIIAFSTCSQSGYMTLACGLSGYNLAFFHLFTHAGFKALLFLSAGTFIHIMSNEQDIRKMSGAFELSPLTSICFIIGSITLMGFPFLSGFFSKDPIIQLAYLYNDNFAIFIFVESGVSFTILYSLKIFYYLFFKENFNRRRFKISSFDLNFFNFGPLIFLSLISIFSGYFCKNLFLGLGNNFFFSSIFLAHSNVLDFEFVYSFVKLIPLILMIFLVYLFYEFYIRQFEVNLHMYFFSRDLFLFFNKRMFFDSLINLFFAFPVYRLSYKIFFIFDKGLLEYFGPYGITELLKRFNELNFKVFDSSNLEFIFTTICVILVNIWFFILFFF